VSLRVNLPLVSPLRMLHLLTPHVLIIFKRFTTYNVTIFRKPSSTVVWVFEAVCIQFYCTVYQYININTLSQSTITEFIPTSYLSLYPSSYNAQQRKPIKQNTFITCENCKAWIRHVADRLHTFTNVCLCEASRRKVA